MDDGLFALDALTGDVRWVFRPPEGCMAGTSWPGSDGQTVYAGASRGSVYAIDATTGAVRWRSQFLQDAIAFSPVVNAGVVFAEFNVQVQTTPFDSGGVVALDAANGTVRWIFYFPRTLAGFAPRGILPVALTTTVVIAPSEDGYVYALDRNTGSFVWRLSRTDSTIGSSRPVAVRGQTVFVGADNGRLTAVDGMSGQELWRVAGNAYVGAVAADSVSVLVALEARSLQLR